MIAQTQDASPDYATAPSPQSPSPAKALTTYSGTYTNEYFGNLEVSVQGDSTDSMAPSAGCFTLRTLSIGMAILSPTTSLARTPAWDAEERKFSPEKNQVLIGQPCSGAQRGLHQVANSGTEVENQYSS